MEAVKPGVKPRKKNKPQRNVGDLVEALGNLETCDEPIQTNITEISDNLEPEDSEFQNEAGAVVSEESFKNGENLEEVLFGDGVCEGATLEAGGNDKTFGNDNNEVSQHGSYHVEETTAAQKEQIDISDKSRDELSSPEISCEGGDLADLPLPVSDFAQPEPESKPMYPSLSSLEKEKPVSPIQHRKILSELPAISGEVEASAVYLTEEQLRTFYMNFELEKAEEFLEAFIKNEMSPSPSNEFYTLVSQYLDSSRSLEHKNAELADLETQEIALKEAVWNVETKEINQQGKCGENKPASGKSSYPVASLRQTALDDLKGTMNKRRSLLMDQWLCSVHESRSGALQCQWFVTKRIVAFMEENRLSTRSPVCVVFGLGVVSETPVRYELRSAFSVLCPFIRLPSLPTAFLNDMKKWLKAIAAVILRGSTEIDHQYILCQLLRCPVSLEDWAVGFVQPLCQVGTGHAKAVIDHFLALMAMLLSPVKMREDFLSQRIETEIHDESWTVVDEEGEEEESRLVAIPETDLLALLNQFSFDKFFLKILQWNNTDEISFFQVITLFAFELTLLKVLSEGIRVYNRPNYRQLCKRIGYLIRQSVQYVAEYWSGCRDLTGENQWMFSCQMEFDRLFIFAVHCLTGARTLGVWQFLVDLPFENASIECQWRLLHLMLSLDVPRLSEICLANAAEISERLKDSEVLVHRLNDLDQADATYLLTALSCLAASTEDDGLCFSITDQLFFACFLNESTRETSWNIGRDIFRNISDRNTKILSRLLRAIDRNVENLNSYAVEVMQRVDLSQWKISIDDLVLIGKWLISRDPTDSASVLAQKILLELNWGPTLEGDLWLTPDCHTMAAECVVKAHVTNCKSQNGLIAASIRKASKLASRVPDGEQQFNSLCWNVILRLKIMPNASISDNLLEKSDLIAFYVKLMVQSMNSENVSVQASVPCLENLANAGCVFGAASVVCAWIFKSAGNIEHLLDAANFLPCMETLVHADAVSWVASMVGSTGFPGKHLDFFNSAIAYQIVALENDGNFKKLDDLCTVWIKILTSFVGIPWNSDRCVLYLLNTIVECLFSTSSDLTVAYQTLSAAHQNLMKTHSGGRGLMSWFSAETPPPLLLDSSFMTEFPWLAYAAVESEQTGFNEMLQKFDAVLVKYSSLSIEQALKKLAQKHKVVLSLNQLPVYRWIELCKGISVDHPLLPLSCQKLSLVMLKRSDTSSDKSSSGAFGLRYLRCESMKLVWDSLKENLETAAKFHRDKTEAFNSSVAELIEAVKCWIWDSRCYNPYGASSLDMPLDFLLQLVLSGDKSPWLNYVDLNKLRADARTKGKFFATLCQLVPGSKNTSNDPTRSLKTGSTAVVRLLNRLQSGSSTVVEAPDIFLHDEIVPRTDLATLCDSRIILGIIGPSFDAISSASRHSISVKKSLVSVDDDLIALLPQLYKHVQTHITVVLKCGSSMLHSCQSPNNLKVLVTSSQLSSGVSMQIDENILRRDREIGKIESMIMANLAYHTSLIQETIRCLISAYESCDANSEKSVFLLDCGICIFRHSVERFQSSLLQSSLSTNSFGKAIDNLGKAFIWNKPEQQDFLVSLITARQDLLDFMAPNFSPHCLSGQELLTLLTTISKLITERKITEQVGIALMSKLSLPAILTSMQPAEANRLTEVVLVTATWAHGNGMSQLYETLRCLWNQLMVGFFPVNFILCFQLLLKGSLEGSIPPGLLNGSLSKFCSEGPPADLVLTPNMAHCGVAAMTECFRTARQNLGTELFVQWKDHVDGWMRTAENLIVILIPPFDQDQPIHETEDGLQGIFTQLCGVFGPWIEPPGGVCPPWTPAHSREAETCLRHFTGTASTLHRNFEKRLPPGYQSVPALFWSYYSTKLCQLKKSGSHVHAGYLHSFLRLPWAAFWPDLTAMHSMVEIMRDEDSFCHPFVTNLLVRVPWSALAQQYKIQPVDACKAFSELLMEMILRCAANEANYMECKASLPMLLDTVSTFDWSLMEAEPLLKVLDWASWRVNPRCIISEETSIDTVLLRFIKTACLFRSNLVLSGQESCVLQKQAAFVRFALTLLLNGVKNGSIPKENCAKYVVDLASHVELITRVKDTLSKELAVIAREFIVFWNKCQSNKVVGSTLKGLCDWLLEHPDANLVLLFINCSVETADALLVSEALTLTETCISAYFHSSRLNCQWQEVSSWLNVPENRMDILRRDNRETEGPWILSLYGNLQKVLPICAGNLREEKEILDELLKLLVGTKRKYLEDEAPLLLVFSTVLDLLIKQFQYVGDAQAELSTLMNWCVSCTENRQSILGMIGISKKQMFSNKFKLICQTVYLFLLQQSLTENVRMDPNSPIMNSRIQTVQDLKNQKHFAPFITTIQSSSAFFKDTNNCFQDCSKLFGQLVKSLYIERYFHLLA